MMILTNMVMSCVYSDMMRLHVTYFEIDGGSAISTYDIFIYILILSCSRTIEFLCLVIWC